MYQRLGQPIFRVQNSIVICGTVLHSSNGTSKFEDFCNCSDSGKTIAHVYQQFRHSSKNNEGLDAHNHCIHVLILKMIRNKLPDNCVFDSREHVDSYEIEKYVFPSICLRCFE